MTRSTAQACAFIFLGVIFLPGVLGVMGMGGTAIENRRLTSFPPVRFASLVDQDFYTAISAFLNDHLPLRDRVVQANSRLAITVWRDSPNPDVHIGLRGWLYTTPFRSTCPGEMPLSVVDALAALGRAYTATGREMRLILSPNKAAIYPEHLGALPPPHYACGREQIDALRARLAQVAEIGFIDIAPRLLRLKDQADEPLYFPADSHWTQRGAAELSHALVDSLGPGLWGDDEVADDGRIEAPMDLALMVGVPQTVMTRAIRTQRAGISTTVVERTDCERGPSCVIRYLSSGDPDRLIRRPTLFVRDSFGTRSIETLAPYFADITFLLWSDDVLEQLSRRSGAADVVVYQTLDHFLFSRVATGFTAQAIPPRR